MPERVGEGSSQILARPRAPCARSGESAARGPGRPRPAPRASGRRCPRRRRGRDRRTGRQRHRARGRASRARPGIGVPSSKVAHPWGAAMPSLPTRFEEPPSVVADHRRARPEVVRSHRRRMARELLRLARIEPAEMEEPQWMAAGCERAVTSADRTLRQVPVGDVDSRVSDDSDPIEEARCELEPALVVVQPAVDADARSAGAVARATRRGTRERRADRRRRRSRR